MALRIAIRVRPGASRTAVGGTFGDDPEGPLVIAVGAQAVDGAATEAALRALAKALGLRRGDLRLILGATSRTKVVEIAGEADELAHLLTKLRSA